MFSSVTTPTCSVVIRQMVASFLLFLVVCVLWWYSEDIFKESALVETLTLQQAPEVLQTPGIVKIIGKPVVLTPISPQKPDNAKPVLYYEHTIEELEAIPETYYGDQNTNKNGAGIGTKIPQTRIVEKWVKKLEDKQWAPFSLGEISVEPKKATLKLDLTEIFSEQGGIGQKNVPTSTVPISNSQTQWYGDERAVESPQELRRRENVKVLSLNEDLIVIGFLDDGSIRDGNPFIISNKKHDELLKDLKTQAQVLYWILKGIMWIVLTIALVWLLKPLMVWLAVIPLFGLFIRKYFLLISILVAGGMVIFISLIVKFWWIIVLILVLLALYLRYSKKF